MNNKKYSNKQEKVVAKTLKGKKQANSGATAFNKGDILTDKFCIECKTSITKKKSISIKKSWLNGLKEDAFAMNKGYYALCFNFGGEEETNENYYIINQKTFKLLNLLLLEEE